MPLIYNIIHYEGYTSLTFYDVNFRPILCPFCLHDSDLPATIRFKDFCTGKYGYVKRVLAHIKALDGEKMVCPAATSNANGNLSSFSCLELMDSEERKDHLGKH